MKNASAVFKYILTGIVLVLTMFILLNTVGLKLMQKKLVETKEEQLYTEANKIINTYLDSYYEQEMSAMDLIKRLEMAGEITDTRI